MHRTACVDVYSLPLQLLLRQHAAWHTRPAAVVTEDKPLGTVTAVNHAARSVGVRPGMRYAAALALASDLQAGTVPEEIVGAGIATIEELLHRFTPVVELAAPRANGEGGADMEAGLFWLNIRGLGRHHSSVGGFAKAIVRTLRDGGFRCAVVAGFTRFGTYVLAKQLASQRQPFAVVPNAAAEREQARSVAIEHLPLDTATRDMFEKLDVLTVGDFLQLPLAELLRRFGPEVAEVFSFASGDIDLPVQGVAQVEQLTRSRRLPTRETDCERLCRYCNELLDILLLELTKLDRAMVELELGFLLENGQSQYESIRPATPSLRRDRLAELIQLRLSSLVLAEGVEEITVAVLHTPLVSGQSELFQHGHRDLAAGAETFARIRAEFGNSVIVQAKLQSSHLPETQFSWEPMVAPIDAPMTAGTTPTAEPTLLPAAHMVRRTLAKPLAITTPDRAKLHRTWGPFLVSSRWWDEVSDRAYYFMAGEHGDLQWVFLDRRSQRWYLQGWVE